MEEWLLSMRFKLFIRLYYTLVEFLLIEYVDVSVCETLI